MARLTVAEAAKVLGITEAGVRKRVQRSQIPHERDDGGRVWVWVSPGETRDAESRDEPIQSRDELVDELHDRIRYLENQLTEERDARRRADTIIAQLSQANAEQARTIRAIEAPASMTEPPSQEPTEEPVTATEQPGRVEPQRSVEAADEAERAGRAPSESAMGGGRLHRSWWRRIFGG
jgi:hypothetical protein